MPEMFVKYSDNISRISPEQMDGFFVGWKNRPNPEKLKKLWLRSDEVIVAIDNSEKKVVGFITAITDKTLSAYIPFLEVLPRFQKKGIGKELVRRMLRKLEPFYMIDIVCDEDLVPYYEKLGLKRHTAAIKRNYHNQTGV